MAKTELEKQINEILDILLASKSVGAKGKAVSDIKKLVKQAERIPK